MYCLSSFLYLWKENLLFDFFVMYGDANWIFNIQCPKIMYVLTDCCILTTVSSQSNMH